MYTLKQKNATYSRWLRGLPIVLAILVVLFATGNASAACGDPMGARLGPLKLPPMLTESGRLAPGPASIVGLWHVTYTSGGQFFYEAFDQWHNDGTEFESANFVPAEGNVCVGVWRLMPNGTISLHHIGWNFDINGNSIGTFVLTENNWIAPNGNNYVGTFDYKVYDVNGVLIQELTGSQNATRISIP